MLYKRVLKMHYNIETGVCGRNMGKIKRNAVDNMDTIVYHSVKEVSTMNFYSIRDLRTESKNMWADLASGDEVVLTNNGKPSALIISIPEGGFDDTVQAVRQAKAMIALNNMRRKAARAGFLSDDEINDIISEVRKEGRTE